LRRRSGLQVDALGTWGLLRSLRWADCTYADSNAKLLNALKNIPDDERTARFVCCAVYVGLDGTTHTTFGKVEGRIAFVPRGLKGFGYDPLFVPENSGKTFAEYEANEKHAISHRGRAFQQLRAFLETLR
jgi:XTP/dITP diphosphohydrolase